MTVSRNSLLVLTVMATMLAGCANSRFGNNGGGEPPQVVMPGPASSGGVSQSELPPPSDNFPAAPNNSISSNNTQPQQTEVASLQPPTNASDLTPGAIAGVL